MLFKFVKSAFEVSPVLLYDQLIATDCVECNVLV